SAEVDFDPSPEMAIVPSTFRLSADSVLQGDDASVDASIINLSRKYPAENFSVYLLPTVETNSITDSLFIERLEPLESRDVSLDINTRRLREPRAFTMIANPWEIPTEPYPQNNRMTTAALRVSPDNIPPG